MGYVDGANQYEYVQSDPVGLQDPQGTSSSNKPGNAPGHSLGKARDPKARPTPGQEKGVVIQSDFDWMSNACWRLKYNSYVKDVEQRNPRIETYPKGVTKAQFGNILRDPDVVEILFIGHGADGDGFGIIWLNDQGDGVLASEVKEILNGSRSLKRVTLRSCWQGGPMAAREWINAFNILPSQFFAPAYNDKWWYNDPGNPMPALPKPSPPTTRPVPPPSTQPVAP